MIFKIFSKARCTAEDVICLKLYGVQIQYGPSPKFIGIVFDSRLSFGKHLEHLDEKILDRINILKILSYDKNWHLSTTILVRTYKVLLRSVLDYACVTTVACLEKVLNDFETIQNNVLRNIFKIS